MHKLTTHLSTRAIPQLPHKVMPTVIWQVQAVILLHISEYKSTSQPYELFWYGNVLFVEPGNNLNEWSLLSSPQD